MRDKKELADRFFESKSTEKVDFEITLATFFVTFAMSYPVGTTPIISELSAIGVLLVTFLDELLFLVPLLQMADCIRALILLEFLSTPWISDLV